MNIGRNPRVPRDPGTPARRENQSRSAGTHEDRRTKRARTRNTRYRAAMKDWE